MASGLDSLSGMEYPGRVIIIGTLADGGSAIAYAVTGRSPSSQARKFVVGDDGNVYTRPTDETLLAKGNPALLVYPALMFYGQSIAVSNGAQTRLVFEELIRNNDQFASPVELLVKAFRTPQFVAGIDITRFEPDDPNFTPRISGCLTPAGAALAITKRGGQSEPLRSFHDVPLSLPGRGRLIATYTGENANPLPSFVGEPLDIEIVAETVDELAESLYVALGPKSGEPDYRVAVVAAVHLGEGQRRIRIVNRCDL
jgi:IMP cyclohydrolase